MSFGKVWTPITILTYSRHLKLYVPLSTGVCRAHESGTLLWSITPTLVPVSPMTHSYFCSCVYAPVLAKCRWGHVQLLRDFGKIVIPQSQTLRRGDAPQHLGCFYLILLLKTNSCHSLVQWKHFDQKNYMIILYGFKQHINVTNF